MSKRQLIQNLLTGVAGGALAFGGLSAYDNLTQGTSPVAKTSSSSKSGTVKTISTTVNSDTTKAIDKVSDAVVSVINYQKTQDTRDIFGKSSDDAAPSSEEEAGEGSGVIYKKEDGTAYIVTNNHVVAGASSLEVLLSSGEKVKATLVGTDSYSDIAVLKIKSDKVNKIATFAESSQIKVGEPAIAIGSPLGSAYANSATEGIVSAKSRNVVMTNEAGETVNVNAIQTDAAINPGNSGGALINIDGDVIGINSSKIASTTGDSSGTSVEGMGFAIPSDDVVKLIAKLEKDGKIERPALGIQMYALANLTTDTIQDKLKLPDDVTAGVVVTSVQKDMPAEKAGLKKFDVITKIGDKDVTSATDLQSALYAYNIGDKVDVTYYRDGKKADTKVTLDQTSDKLKFEDSQDN